MLREIKSTTVVQFTWVATGRDFEAEHTVDARCNNACTRGVSLPEPLKSAYRWYRLDEAANASEADARTLAGSAAEITSRRTPIKFYILLRVHISVVLQVCGH